MNILWSPQAKRDFWNNIDYLEGEFSEKVAANFIKKATNTIQLIKDNKVTFVKTNYKNIHKAVITKQISLYYRIENNNLQLPRFWNTFQDPKQFNL